LQLAFATWFKTWELWNYHNKIWFLVHVQTKGFFYITIFLPTENTFSAATNSKSNRRWLKITKIFEFTLLLFPIKIIGRKGRKLKYWQVLITMIKNCLQLLNNQNYWKKSSAPLIILLRRKRVKSVLPPFQNRHL